MGMLATVMNALAMQNALETLDMPTQVMSALPISVCASPISAAVRCAISKKSGGRCRWHRQSVFHRYGAALRASKWDVLPFWAPADGVYSADPEKDPDVRMINSVISGLSEDLKVMDASAVSLARENNIPILVFSIEDAGGFQRVLRHEGKFTIVS